MKPFATFLLVLLASPVAAQPAPRLSASVYANTSAPLLVGVSTRLSGPMRARLSAGYFTSSTDGRAASSAAQITQSVEHTAVAAALLLDGPQAWRLRSYAGPSVQVVNGRRTVETSDPRYAAAPRSRSRSDIGLLVGAEVDGPWGLGGFAETSLGYGAGFRGHSPDEFDQTRRGFGATTFAIGVRAQLLR